MGDFLNYLLGVDIGGSKADFLLTSEDGAEIRHLTAPSKNLTNPDKSDINLLLSVALDELATVVPLKDVSRVCFGVAGLHTGNRGQITDLLEQSISRHTAAKVLAVNDAIIGFRALFDSREGIALIAGTGSIAARIQADLVIRTAGGTGARFGDQGSAFWIGKKTIQHIFSTFDLGVIDPEILAELGIAEHDPELSKWNFTQYVNQISATEVAAISMKTTRWAESLPWARDILSSAADHLINLVKHLHPKNEPVALIGSLFSRNEFIQDKVHSALVEIGLHPAIAFRPVEGAIKLARNF